MTDLFTPRNSQLYIRIAASFGVFAGAAELLLCYLRPDLVTHWAIPEALVVMALAYGVWRHNFAAAIGLVSVKVLGAAVVMVQTRAKPSVVMVAQLLFYVLAAAAINLERVSRSSGPLPRRERES
jgi:hypothetical protein